METPQALEPEAPSALPAPKRTYKPRASKAAVAAPSASGTRKRASGVTDIIVAAVAKNGRPNLEALAKQIYGEASPKTVKRVQLAVYATATKGRIAAKGDGSYTVLG